MSLPDSWFEVRLDAVCLLNPRLAADERPDDETEVTFVPMSAVDEGIGEVTKPEVRTYGEVSKGYTSFKNRDVLFAKVTPCMENGKAAIAGSLLNGLGFGSTEFHVLRPTDVVLPEYLFHFIRQPVFRTYAASAFVGTGGLQRVPPDFLARVKLPLPTFPEQQRIVEVLRQAEVIAKVKRSISEQIDQLVRTLYWEHFGDWYTAAGLRDPVRISEYVDDSQYGVSEAMGESGSHAVLRMNSITTSGWLDLSELKYASLSKKDADNTTLQNGDLLFNRTNSKELVGKCAIWRGAEGAFSFASYLIRLRLKDGMLPEYLWATLNSAYGKYRLMNSAKQAVSMANVSPTDLKRITVPLPPLKLQKDFARLVRQIEALRVEMLAKVASFEELQNIVTQQALTGEATAEWREKHLREIEDAAAIRDAALGKHAAKPSVKITESAPAERPTSYPRPARLWLTNELSEFQHEVWNTLRHEWRGSVIVDDPEVFGDFCTSPQTAWRIEHFQASPNRIRRTLEQLAALGLIAKISVPKLNPLTRQAEYLTAFRPLREEENTRLADADLMRRALSLESSGANE